MSKVMSLGNIRARSKPAGTGNPMGPKPWAAYPASGGPNEMMEPPYGDGPQWRTNFITTPVSTPQEPQNPQRVFNGGVPFEQSPTGSSAGSPIYGMTLAGLGAARKVPGLVNPSNNRTSFTMGLGASPVDPTFRAQEVAYVMANEPENLDPCIQGYWVGGRFITNANMWRWDSMWLTAVGIAVGAYHGYHRNRRSLGWSFGWGLLGALFPVITTGVALVQGPGKSK